MLVMYNIYLLNCFCSIEEFDKASSIAFSAGKGCCGCGFQGRDETRFFVVGKWCDVIRVYSALKNSGYKCVLRREEND